MPTLRLLPRTRWGTWSAATAAWAAAVVVAWWLLPDQLRRRSVIACDTPLTEVVFGPGDGWLAARAAGDGPSPVRFWDTESGHPTTVLDGPPPACDRLLGSPDGRWLLTVERGGDTDRLTRWDAQAGAQRSTVSVASAAEGGDWCFAPATAPVVRVAGAERDGVRLYDLPDLRPGPLLPDASGPLAFSADGRFLAATTDMGRVPVVWDIHRGTRVQVPSLRFFGSFRYQIQKMALSATGDRLAATWRSSREGTCYVQFRDLPAGGVLQEGYHGTVFGVTAPDLVVGLWLDVDGGSLRGFDMRTGAERYRVPSAEDWFLGTRRGCVGGGWAAVVEAYQSGWERKLDEWSSKPWFPFRRTPSPARQTVGVYAALDGRLDGRAPGPLAGSTPWLAPDGRLLAVQRDNMAVDLWELPARKPVGWFAVAAGLLGFVLAALGRWRVRRLNRVRAAGGV